MKKTPKIPEGKALITKLEFESIDQVNDALFFAFHPDGFSEDEEDRDEEMETKFFAMWNTFLMLSGWTNDEYWEKYSEVAKNSECTCGQNLAEEKKEEVKPSHLKLVETTTDNPS